jgi:hypothetical protein
VHRLRDTFLRWFAAAYVASYKRWTASVYDHPRDERVDAFVDWNSLTTAQYGWSL